MDLELSCVESFLALAREGRYDAAAERLNLTPSALTKRLARLERQVGAKLVTRDDRGRTQLTAAGRRFQEPASHLLATAEAARRAARGIPDHGSHTLVLGLPAGPTAFLRPVLARVLNELRADWPDIRLVCRPIPFPRLTSCLLDEEVDVLWTATPVRHSAIDSAPLPFIVSRVGLVPPTHPLVGARDVPAAEFAALPMLYNPAVPDEWMSVFYLGDVRPRSEARLVPGTSTETQDVPLEASRRGAAVVTVAPAMFGTVAPQRLHPVALTGAAPITFHAAYRAHDHRGTVRSLVTALRTSGSAELDGRTRPKASASAHSDQRC
jgi:DNA-binding transcriptional LysR family regulator